MEIVLQNMCMIYDKHTDRILILDKVKKQGWEGLTFVGGHIENGESVYDSCIREVFEETGLVVSDLKLKGTVSWVDVVKNKRELAFLFYTENFSGELIEDNVEGKLFWMSIDEFKNASGKSENIDELFKLYTDDNISELYVNFEDGKCKNFKFL